MKPTVVFATVILLAGGAIWLAGQAGSAVNRPLASNFPAGPVLYLQAKNLQSLLSDWDSSKEKQLWLSSDNYGVFSRSVLLQKLQRAQDEFAAAAGIPPDMALLSNVAGADSALAIYDIGKLEFLYITRLPAARVTASPLWKARGSYEPRHAAGFDYYVKLDRPSKRVAAFATAQDYLLLATREDVLAGALSLIASQNVASMAGEPWYAQAIQSAKAQGELRLVLNMPLLMQSPYMRSYWIQRNASELKQYSSAVSDASRSPGLLTENRILLRANEDAASWNEAAVAQVTRLVPEDAGLYRAWASPSTDEAFALIRDRMIEHQVTGTSGRQAPSGGSMDVIVGAEADLETRIDEPALDSGRRGIAEEARKLLDTSKLDAMLYTGATRLAPDGVFVGIDSAVVLLRANSWPPGAGSQFDSLGSLSIGSTGGVLVIANQPDFLRKILAQVNRPALSPARYAALYRHSREFPNFERMTRLIDNPMKQEGPMFFSQNVASFGRSILGRLDEASITIHDTGAVVSQSLTYKLKP